MSRGRGANSPISGLPCGVQLSAADGSPSPGGITALQEPEQASDAVGLVSAVLLIRDAVHA